MKPVQQMATFVTRQSTTCVKEQMQKGGNQVNPGRCTGITFPEHIGVFRLAGSFIWNEEAAGSNPVSYTLEVGSGWQSIIFQRLTGKNNN